MASMSCLAHLHHRVDMCRSRMSKQQQFEIVGAFLAEATCMLAVLAVLVLPAQGAKAWVLGVVGMGLPGYRVTFLLRRGRCPMWHHDIGASCSERYVV